MKDFKEDDSIDLMNSSQENVKEKISDIGSFYGLNGLKKYQKLYKNHYNLLRKPAKNEATTNYFNTIEKLKLDPLSTGIVRRRGENSHINANNFKIGDNYASAMGNTFSYFPQLK